MHMGKKVVSSNSSHDDHCCFLGTGIISLFLLVTLWLCHTVYINVFIMMGLHCWKNVRWWDSQTLRLHQRAMLLSLSLNDSCFKVDQLFPLNVGATLFFITNDTIQQHYQHRQYYHHRSHRHHDSYRFL